MRAARFGRVTTAQVLLQHGSAMDAGDGNGDTPLHYAAHYGHHGVVGEHDAGIGLALLSELIAVACSNVCCRAELFLDHCGDCILASGNVAGYTALHVACQYGQQSAAVSMGSDAYMNCQYVDLWSLQANLNAFASCSSGMWLQAPGA